MGSVYEVFDGFLWRTVAAKFVRADVPDPEELASAFLEEARITAQLEHPNVIPVYDLGLDPARGVFFCMKLLRGRSLQELFADAHAGPLTRATLRRLLTVVLRVCDALSFAHGRGVVHRDVKPENVLVGSHGQVYLTDWGIALVKAPVTPASGSAVELPPDARGTAGGKTLAGTVAYMAPEQAGERLAEVDARTDVYGLGGILHHLLTGRAPHEEANVVRSLESARRGTVRPIQPNSAWPDVPPGLVEIALKALSADPAARHQTADEFADELVGFLDGGGWFATEEFAAGSAIVTEGEPGDTAYIIVEGRCRVSKLVGETDTFVRELGPGDVFGETAVLATRTRTASVVAIDHVLVKIVTREALESELSGSPILGSFMRALVDRFVDLERRSSIPGE
jgi:serine/threonine-protein kinase